MWIWGGGSLAKPSVFFLMVRMRGGKEEGEGKEKYTSGKMCKVYVPSAGMWAGPIKAN